MNIVCTHTTLWHYIIWVRLAEACALEQIHDVGFAGTFLIETVFILLKTDCPTQDNLVVSSWEPIVGVIENDFNCNI